MFKWQTVKGSDNASFLTDAVKCTFLSTLGNSQIYVKVAKNEDGTSQCTRTIMKL